MFGLRTTEFSTMDGKSHSLVGSPSKDSLPRSLLLNAPLLGRGLISEEKQWYLMVLGQFEINGILVRRVLNRFKQVTV